VRHRKNNVGLNRTAAHRKALLANLTTMLVTHKKIITTLPKARATRCYAERIITFARKGDVAARRQVLSKLRSRDIVKILFEEIGPKFRDRNGGYTRIVKLDNRHGDGAEMAVLELVGFAPDETKKKRKPAAKKGAKPKQAEEQAVEAEETAEVEEGAEELAEQQTEAKPKKTAPKKAAPKKATPKKATGKVDDKAKKATEKPAKKKAAPKAKATTPAKKAEVSKPAKTASSRRSAKPKTDAAADSAEEAKE
jgi:large subunit ribosomal protein L17